MEGSMVERPIIFSTPMVRAILDGRKTQTRRVVKNQNLDGSPPLSFQAYETEDENGNVVFGFSSDEDTWKCPYGQPGDWLWVRETWRQAYAKTYFSDGIIYRADQYRAMGMDEFSDRHAWKPSIHMPKKYARIWLEITDIRVERLQEINQEEADDEGADWCLDVEGDCFRERFKNLWDSINGKKHPWESNPWVWVVEFKVITDRAQ